MSKLEEIKALENGKSIQYLLNSAYKIFNNPMFMFDSNYNLIAFTNVFVDDPIWNELITSGTLSSQTLEFLANEHMTEDITNAEKTVVLRREQLKYARMSGLVHNRDNIFVGLITMYECNTPFDAPSELAFAALADKISFEIRDYDYFTMLAMTYHEDKINYLLDEPAQNPLLYNAQTQVLYSNFEDYLYVAAVSVERHDILERVFKSRLAYFKSMIKTKYPAFKYSVHEDHIVMLMSSKHRYFYGAPFFAAHLNLFEQSGLFMGVSDSFENMYELRKYYDQAVKALAKGLKDKNDQRVFLYQND